MAAVMETPPTASMRDIQRLARDYADARDALAEVTDEVRAIQRIAVRTRLRAIQTRAAKVSAAKEALREAVDASRELFAKPKTQSAHGIKFGLRKSPGRVEGDAAGAIARIEKRLPERAPQLIRVKQELNKAGLLTLTAQELAALGVAVVDTDDKVVVQAAAGELDALVEALLADANEADANGH